VSSPVERQRAEKVALEAGGDRVVDRLVLSMFSGDANRC